MTGLDHAGAALPSSRHTALGTPEGKQILRGKSTAGSDRLVKEEKISILNNNNGWLANSNQLIPLDTNPWEIITECPSVRCRTDFPGKDALKVYHPPIFPDKSRITSQTSIGESNGSLSDAMRANRIGHAASPTPVPTLAVASIDSATSSGRNPRTERKLGPGVMSERRGRKSEDAIPSTAYQYSLLVLFLFIWGKWRQLHNDVVQIVTGFFCYARAHTIHTI